VLKGWKLPDGQKKVCPALRRADTSKQNEKPTFIFDSAMEAENFFKNLFLIKKQKIA
jgi:hypothetical protein